MHSSHALGIITVSKMTLNNFTYVLKNSSFEDLMCSFSMLSSAGALHFEGFNAFA